MKFQKTHLLEAGFNDGPVLEQIYASGLDIISNKGIQSVSYLIKQLKRKYPEHHGSLTLRDQPAPLSLAIDASDPVETKNLTKTLKQMQELLRCPMVVEGSLMPDACPAGSDVASMPVGGAIAVKDAIIPAAHSSDISCSLHASFFDADAPVANLLDSLQSITRFGPGGRAPNEQIHHPVLDEPIWNNPFLRRLESKAHMHMADQGDGNHFAFLGEIKITSDLTETLSAQGHQELANALKSHTQLKVLITHHGSRGLGAALYKRGLEAAIKHTRKYASNIPDAAAWISTLCPEGKNYWEALQYVSRWTKANHATIHQRFLQQIQSPLVASIGNEHNFVWRRDNLYYHGKGATPAWSDSNGNPLLGLIPLNMAAPILLTLGKNQGEYLSFSPHGAGRNLARKALLKKLQRGARPQIQDAITSGTEHIDARWFLGEPDVTECPIAYKSPTTIRQQIQSYQLADVIAEIHPLGCIMAGRSPKYEKPLTPKQLRQIHHRSNRRKMRQHDWLTEE
ncbi:RtcB family protein [Rubritalea tangerina]|uniref:3'-phosphate/5'-hydroxy nucleic acid ligase n=1 Tax=Rubritalea tangerina TaxID=430798 RepID=A0ABW4Z6Z7_9BACT